MCGGHANHTVSTPVFFDLTPWLGRYTELGGGTLGERATIWSYYNGLVPICLLNILPPPANRAAQSEWVSPGVCRVRLVYCALWYYSRRLPSSKCNVKSHAACAFDGDHSRLYEVNSLGD